MKKIKSILINIRKSLYIWWWTFHYGFKPDKNYEYRCIYITNDIVFDLSEKFMKSQGWEMFGTSESFFTTRRWYRRRVNPIVTTYTDSTGRNIIFINGELIMTYTDNPME